MPHEVDFAVAYRACLDRLNRTTEALVLAEGLALTLQAKLEEVSRGKDDAERAAGADTAHHFSD